MRNDGAPQRSMAAMIGGSLSNVVLDYVFMFPFGMGIFGAVFATGLAPVISMGILAPFFLQKKSRFRLRVKAYSMAGWLRQAGYILSSGLPSLITEVSSGIVIIVFNAVILRLQGNTGVAAYGVIANLSLVVIAIYTGIAQGVQPLMSSAHGTGEGSRVRIYLRYALLTMLLVSAAIYACVFFGAGGIASIFNSEKNALLQSIAETGLRIYFTGCVFAGFNIILSVFFTSTENVLPAHIISLLRGFFIIIPAAFLLSAAFGMTGVWCAFPLTELLVSAIGAAVYLQQEKSVLRSAP